MDSALPEGGVGALANYWVSFSSPPFASARVSRRMSVVVKAHHKRRTSHAQTFCLAIGGGIWYLELTSLIQMPLSRDL